METTLHAEGEYSFCRRCLEAKPITYIQAIDEWLDSIEKNNFKGEQ
jgi:hypothetical protein